MLSPNFVSTVWERNFQGTKVPWSESSWTFRSTGTYVPGNDSSTGTKIPFVDFSLPGTKVQRNEKSRYPSYREDCPATLAIMLVGSLVYGLFAPLHFHSRKRKVYRWNFRSLEHSLLGTLAPVELLFLESERSKNFRSLEYSFPWNFRSSGVNVPRTFIPWHFCSGLELSFLQRE